MKEELTNNYILLLLLYADSKKPIIGRTRLQKLVFLYEKECQKIINQKNKNLFDFCSYDYGPFSKELYKHVNILKKYELINTSSDFHSNDFKSNTVDSNTKYLITKAGIECVEEEILKKIMNPLEVDIINEFKIKYNNQDLGDLIRFVYKAYPDYTNNSKIKEKVLGNLN